MLAKFFCLTSENIAKIFCLTSEKIAKIFCLTSEKIAKIFCLTSEKIREQGSLLQVLRAASRIESVLNACLPPRGPRYPG